MVRHHINIKTKFSHTDKTETSRAQMTHSESVYTHSPSARKRIKPYISAIHNHRTKLTTFSINDLDILLVRWLLFSIPKALLLLLVAVVLFLFRCFHSRWNFRYFLPFCFYFSSAIRFFSFFVLFCASCILFYCIHIRFSKVVLSFFPVLGKL